MNKSFSDTFACRSGHHCRTCRDRTDGVDFRANIAARFSLMTTDWPCPRSRPWDFEGNATPLPASHPPAPPTRQHPRAIASPEVTSEAGSTLSTDSGQANLTEIKRRFAICKSCPHTRDNAFACALHPSCCFGKFRSNSDNRCPAGKW